MSTLNIEINGVVDTGVDVLTNINRIADAALCYVSWDLSVGKWSVIIKEPDSSVASFDDSNIVGAITVSGSGLRETYNSATIRFPHKDLDSESDYVTVTVPTGDRYPNELDNELQMSTALVNDPVHAQYMASIELANSRLDQIIQFSTDFSQLGVTAGDLIAVTNSVYGFSNKLFRVQRVSERDNTDGTLLIDIVAQEYEDIYSQPLARTDADRTNGIMPYEVCEELQAADDAATNPTDCICSLGTINLGSINITADTNGVYAQDDWAFFVTELFETQQDPNDPPILAGYTTSDFEVTNTLNFYETGVTFTAPLAGVYTFPWTIGYSKNLNPGPGNGFSNIAPNNIRFKSQMQYRFRGKLYNNFNSQTNTVIRVFPANVSQKFGVVNLSDASLTGARITMQQGDTVEFVMRAKTDFGPSHPDLYDVIEIAVSGTIAVNYTTQEQIDNFRTNFTGI